VTANAMTIPEQADQALAFQATRERLLVLASESARITEITGPDGYKECHARRMVLKTTRVEIQKVAKDARDDAVKFQKAIIGKEKELIDLIEPEERRLQELQEAVDKEAQRKKDEEARIERERVEAVNRRFQDMREIPAGALNLDAAGIQSLIDSTETIDPGTFPQDMQAAAQYEKRLVVTTLRAALDARLQAEQEAEKVKVERAELERLRAEADAVRAEADRLAAAERERVAAEGRRQEEEARRQREEQEAKERAERAERQRIEDEERATAAAQLRRDQEAAAAERAKLEAEKKAAAKKAREQAIANASLLSAAGEAVELLTSNGLGEHIVTQKLASAIAREAQERVAA
jgi:hypothetical protein